MQKIKIVMADISYRGGIAVYRNSLSKSLANLGVNVLTVAPYCRELSEIQIAKTLKPIIESGWWLKVKPLWIIDRSYSLLKNTLVRNSFVKYVRPNILHIQLTFPIFDIIFPNRLDIPQVLTLHNIFAHERRMENSRIITNRFYKQFSAIIVHSKQNRDELLTNFQIHKDKVYVIPHGCDKAKLVGKEIARKKLKLPLNSYPQILFAGSIRIYKGLNILLESFHHILPYFPNARLVVAGNVPYRRSFKSYYELIQKLNISDKVILRIDRIPQKDFDLYFQSSDITVLPYIEFHSQSGILLRAYSNQCPAVVTEVGNMGITANNDCTGIVVRPNSHLDLMRGIIDLSNDRRKQKKIKANMSHCIESKYNWHKVGQQTLKIYKTLLINR